jgi:hypothetical protein
MSAPVNARVVSTSASILQGVGKLTIDGVDVGGFAGGVKMTWQQSEVFVESDWQLGPVDSEITKVECSVDTELEEATLENLAAALGMHSSSVVSGASSKLFNLNPEESMLNHQLVFEGMSGIDRTKIRTFTIPKAVRVGSSTMTLNRGVKTTIPVSFKCLMVSGSFGTIADAR